MESPVAGMEASSWSPTTRMSPLANPPPSSDLAPPWGRCCSWTGGAGKNQRLIHFLWRFMGIEWGFSQQTWCFSWDNELLFFSKRGRTIQKEMDKLKSWNILKQNAVLSLFFCLGCYNVTIVYYGVDDISSALLGLGFLGIWHERYSVTYFV